MIAPDTKDWTWVLREQCPECGVHAGHVAAANVSRLLRDCLPRWQTALTSPQAKHRAEPDRWSPLEYACHVRDALRVYADRLERMLAEDEPRFADWDQNAAAIDARYASADPRVVAAELRDALLAFANRLDSVPMAAWSRTGIRSDGVTFSIDSLARYLAHDILHHLWDVGSREDATRTTTAGDAEAN